MAVFTYKAVNPAGRRVKAVAMAPSAEELERDLSAQGFAVLDIREGGRLEDTSREELRKKDAGPRPSAVPRRELIQFCIFLGTQLEAGISLHASLTAFAQETTHAWLKHVVLDLLRQIESGNTLSEAMNAYPQVFIHEFVHLVRAGERTGTLARAFHDLRRHLEWLENLMGSVRQATTYPLVVSIALLGFILYLFAFVIPKIARVLEDLHLQLPIITRVVFGAGHVMTKTWWIWLICGVGLFWLVRYGPRRSERFALELDRLKLRLPVMGELYSMILQSRFTHHFAVMHRAGISVLENLELCGELVGNRVFRDALAQARREVREGSRLTDALRATGVFSGLVTQMLQVGESTGNLEKALQFATDFYDQEVPRVLKRVFAVLEPIMILFLVGVVALVALSIFMPILSISGGLR